MLVTPDQIETMADWLNHPAVCDNPNPALQYQDQIVSYGELASRTRRVANALSGLGVKAGDRVAILDKNSHRYLETMLACSLIGAAPVGVNWRLAPPEVAYIIKDTLAPVVLCGEEFAGLIENIRGELTEVRHLIATDFAREGWHSYDDWRDAASDERPAYSCRPEDTILQLYTSGTTGHPKGAELTHANFLSTLHSMQQDGWMDWEASDINLICMPMFHIAGSNWALVGLLAGCRNIILRDIDPTAILQLIESEKVSRVLFVPAVILFLMHHPNISSTDLSSVRQIAYGASPIPEDLLKSAMAAFQCDFIQLYGLTETSGYTTHMSADVHRQGGDKLRSCGKANSNVEVQIQDEQGRALPVGEIGEIVTRAGSVMKGYWNLPEQTASTFRNGWFRTGDAGYLDEEGFVFIHDRIKDMIVSGGENIYPAEIESALFAHPDIADVAVFGIPDDKWGETVHACLVKAEGSDEIALEDLQTFARERLAGYKIPRSMEYVDTLPRNPSGKILRRLLREKYWQGKERQVN